MDYKQEFNILSFDFWSGAKWIQSPDLTNEQLTICEDVICNSFAGIPTATAINDFVWFNLKEIIKHNHLFGDDFDYSQF